MTDAKHTPGPWMVFRVEDGPNTGKILGIGDRNGGGVIDASGRLWRTGGEMTRNADLIAAAPDLAECAEPFANVAANLNPDLPGSTEVEISIGGKRVYVMALQSFRDLRAAIAKATGADQ